MLGPNSQRSRQPAALERMFSMPSCARLLARIAAQLVDAAGRRGARHATAARMALRPHVGAHEDVAVVEERGSAGRLPFGFSAVGDGGAADASRRSGSKIEPNPNPSRRRRQCTGRNRCPDNHARQEPHGPQPPRRGDQPLSAPAQGQPGALAALGRGGAGRRQGAGQADPAVDRLCRLPLVPCDGA